MSQIVKFFDRNMRPPRGGWSFPLGGAIVEKYSESDILAAIKRWRVNNGSYESDEKIERELWAYYCNREPNRCRGSAHVMPETQFFAPLELTPRIYGPWIWRFMNFAAVRFEREFFINLCDRLIVMIDCPDCKTEWRAILRDDPPTGLETPLQACLWVNKQHNRVNAKLGKSHYPYDRMVLEYGAPLPAAA